MASISRTLWNEVMMADNFTCVYCGRRGPGVGIDHLIPQSQHGPDVFQNLVTCCPSCNSRKSAKGLHTLNTPLRFGRFERTRSQKTRRGLRPSQLHPPLPLRPVMTKEQHTYRVRELALEMCDGKYVHSANAICKLAGGTRADVLAVVSGVRPPPPVKTVPNGVRLTKDELHAA